MAGGGLCLQPRKGRLLIPFWFGTDIVFSCWGLGLIEPIPSSVSFVNGEPLNNDKASCFQIGSCRQQFQSLGQQFLTPQLEYTQQSHWPVTYHSSDFYPNCIILKCKCIFFLSFNPIKVLFIQCTREWQARSCTLMNLNTSVDVPLPVMCQ